MSAPSMQMARAGGAVRRVGMKGAAALFIAGIVSVASGWLAGAATGRGAAFVARGGAPAPSSGETCMDPAAMKANAELVDQVRDYKERLARAEDAAKAREVKASARASDAPEAFVPGVDAWARMSQTGVFRVKTPCSNWDGHGHFEVRRPNRGSVTMGGRRIDAASRADAAGVSREELTAVVEAYTRAHKRAWAAVRTTCEANDAYREMMDESEDELDEEHRLLACRRLLLAPGSESMRSAVRRVAELRAANASASRANTDEERVLFAMTESMSTLWDELVSGLGREKTLAAIDYGVLCTHETVFVGRDKDGA